MRHCSANLLVVACAALAPPAGAVSLFEETTYRALTADRKAYRPGDLLTVLVFETASATASANTNTEKNGGLGFDLKSNFTTPKGASLTLSEDFSGGGRIQRSGRLAAQLTVIVRSVEDNGDLSDITGHGAQVAGVIADSNLLLVKGSVPGAINAYLEIRKHNALAK